MSMDQSLPVLYSFRRCPYAIRARMAIAVSEQQAEHREVDLKRKPQELIQISPKATVPVLQLPGGQVLEESLDIMHWALAINDPNRWLASSDNPLSAELIQRNDNDFKQHLDHYKYADRFPAYSLADYRERACIFPTELDALLRDNAYVVSDQPSLADIAIFPFIRQFAFVDKNWFDNMPWNHLQHWLDYFLGSELFQTVMQKHQPWKAGDKASFFP